MQTSPGTWTVQQVSTAEHSTARRDKARNNQMSVTTFHKYNSDRNKQPDPGQSVASVKLKELHVYLSATNETKHRSTHKLNIQLWGMFLGLFRVILHTHGSWQAGVVYAWAPCWIWDKFPVHGRVWIDVAVRSVS